eukprot:361451-Chlamydomonas_euryale.AAC.8
MVCGVERAGRAAGLRVWRRGAVCSQLHARLVMLAPGRVWGEEGLWKPALLQMHQVCRRARAHVRGRAGGRAGPGARQHVQGTHSSDRGQGQVRRDKARTRVEGRQVCWRDGAHAQGRGHARCHDAGAQAMGAAAHLHELPGTDAVIQHRARHVPQGGGAQAGQRVQGGAVGAEDGQEWRLPHPHIVRAKEKRGRKESVYVCV